MSSCPDRPSAISVSRPWHISAIVEIPIAPHTPFSVWRLRKSSASGAPGRVRKISVKVPGHGKVVVRHRVGYRLQQ